MTVTQGNKVVLIGAGAVGTAYAYATLNQGLADHLAIIDLNDDLVWAQVEDLNHAIPFSGQHMNVTVGTYEDCRDAALVVNCAGVATPGKLVGRDGPLSAEVLSRVLAINAVGTVSMMAQAAAAMKAQEPLGEDRGVIVNTASVAAYDGQIGQIAYSASKGAVVALTLPAARELASSQIRVVTIAPGLMETPMMAGLPEAAREALSTKTPHPARLGRPEDYALLVEQIVSNPFLNGEVIRLDGAVRLEPR